MPNHYADDLLHTTAISGLSRVRTELLPLLVVPSLAPHPVQVDRKFSGHRHLGDLSSRRMARWKNLLRHVGGCAP